MFAEICRANVLGCLLFEVSHLGSNLSVDYDELKLSGKNIGTYKMELLVNVLKLFQLIFFGIT